MFSKLKKTKQKIATGDTPQSLKEVAEVVHSFTDTKDEKREFYQEVSEQQAEEREETREWYRELQSKFLHHLAAHYLLALWAVCTLAFIFLIATGKFRDLSTYEAGIISAIQALLTREVSGLFAFLYGGNETANESTKSLFQAQNPADNSKNRHDRKMERLAIKKEKAKN